MINEFELAHRAAETVSGGDVIIAMHGVRGTWQWAHLLGGASQDGRDAGVRVQQVDRRVAL